MSTVTTEAPVEPDQRDPGLWHHYLDSAPERAFCGLWLGDTEPGVDFGTEKGPRCRVCEDLAAAYFAGRWTP